MGRRFNNKGNRNRTKKADTSTEGEKPNNRENYAEFVRENEVMQKFYREQNICADDEEFELFLSALRTPLPASFRITGSKEGAIELKNMLENVHFPTIKDIEIDGERIELPHELPFYPRGLAYQYRATRQQIRKCEQLKTLYEFLVEETEIGNISRQEAVSMVPPLLMDIKGHHKVMDMCAAPGSKTAQILEMMQEDAGENGISSGLVVANDVDNNRAYTLIHQLKRLGCYNLVVTNHDSAHYPTIYTNDNQPMTFDRILADVPCSGDGTMRKNPQLWLRWTPGMGNGLHPMQVNILKRAMQLVKVGGRVVYSTCSLNPVENEAVIAEILREYPGSVSVKDVSDELPGLKRMPGLTEWKVGTKSGNLLEVYEQVAENQTSIKKSMFPPEDQKIKNQLLKCIRILPHFQDTGAFFVAVLEKNAPITKNDAEEPVVSVVKEDQPQKRQRVHGMHKEEPFILMPADTQEIMDFCEHYGLKQGFPLDQFVARSDDGKNRNLYFVSQGVRDLISCPQNESLRIVNMGVRSFGRNTITKYVDSDGAEVLPNQYCSIRIHQEFMPIVWPFLSENRCVDFTKQDLVKALTEEFPFIDTFSNEVAMQLNAHSFGGIVIRYGNMVISGWRARTSINALVNSKLRASLIKKIEISI